MQTIGHIQVLGEQIKVLVRPNIKGGYVSLKKRKTGKLGTFLVEESLFLMDEPEEVERLLEGKVVYC